MFSSKTTLWWQAIAKWPKARDPDKDQDRLGMIET